MKYFEVIFCFHTKRALLNFGKMRNWKQRERLEIQAQIQHQAL